MAFVKKHKSGVAIVMMVLLAVIGWATSAMINGGEQRTDAYVNVSEELLQNKLQNDIGRHETELASTADAADQAEIRLAVAECYLDVVPGEEFLAAKQALAVLESDAGESDKIRANLLLAESFRSWKYEALRLYTQVADGYPGTEWEAWAKIGMARTLAAEQTGGESEPSFQCERAAALLDEVITQFPNTECARAARHLLPQTRAYFDLPGAIRDLQVIAAGMARSEIDDALGRMAVMAARGVDDCDQIASEFEQASLRLPEALATPAGQWAAAFRQALAEGIAAVDPDERGTVADAILICEKKSQTGEDFEELVQHLPEAKRGSAWVARANELYWAGDKDTARVYLEHALECHSQYDEREYSVDTANDIGKLAWWLGRSDIAINVLQDALARWPNNHLSTVTLVFVAEMYDLGGQKNAADALYTKLLTEFPKSKHSVCRYALLQKRFGLRR